MSEGNIIGTLRIGLIGSGFVAKFHVEALLSVRHVTVSGIYSPNAKHRDALAQRVNELELGPCRAFPSLEAMLLSGEVQAVWILSPNDTRLETMREISSPRRDGQDEARRSCLREAASAHARRGARNAASRRGR